MEIYFDALVVEGLIIQTRDFVTGVVLFQEIDPIFSSSYSFFINKLAAYGMHIISEINGKALE